METCCTTNAEQKMYQLFSFVKNEITYCNEILTGYFFLYNYVLEHIARHHGTWPPNIFDGGGGVILMSPIIISPQQN